MKKGAHEQVHICVSETPNELGNPSDDIRVVTPRANHKLVVAVLFGTLGLVQRRLEWGKWKSGQERYLRSISIGSRALTEIFLPAGRYTVACTWKGRKHQGERRGEERDRVRIYF